jgi:hypothetical protein
MDSPPEGAAQAAEREPSLQTGVAGHDHVPAPKSVRFQTASLPPSEAGITSFRDVLTGEDIDAIQAYLVHEQHELRQEEPFVGRIARLAALEPTPHTRQEKLI